MVADQEKIEDLREMSISTSRKALDAIWRTAEREAGTLCGMVNARAISFHLLRAADTLRLHAGY